MKLVARVAMVALLSVVAWSATSAQVVDFPSCVKAIYRAYFECLRLGFEESQCDGIITYGVPQCDINYPAQ